MGKGDKKSRRGKIILGSFGVRRPRKKKTIIISKTKKEVKTEVINKKFVEVKAIKDVEIVAQEHVKEHVAKIIESTPIKKDVKPEVLHEKLVEVKTKTEVATQEVVKERVAKTKKARTI